MSLEPVEVIILGPHNTGRTTLASLIKMFLEENGYRDVKIVDTEPLPADQKPSFWDRFQKNRERPVIIKVFNGEVVK